MPNGSAILAIFLNLFISWFTCYQLLQHYFSSLSYTLSQSVSSAASLAHPRKERVQRSCKIGASPEGLRVLIWIIAVGISGFDNLSLLVRLLIVIYASAYISRMWAATMVLSTAVVLDMTAEAELDVTSTLTDSELSARMVLELSLELTPSQQRRGNSRTMQPHGPTANLLFLLSLILSSDHLIEPSNGTIDAGSMRGTNDRTSNECVPESEVLEITLAVSVEGGSSGGGDEADVATPADEDTASSSYAGAESVICKGDGNGKFFVWQRDWAKSWIQCNKVQVLCRALGPGSPARQGAEHE